MVAIIGSPTQEVQVARKKLDETHLPDPGDLAIPGVDDPTPDPVEAGSDDDVAPADDAVAHDAIPEPDNTYGKAVHDSLREGYGENYPFDVDWSEAWPETRRAFVNAALSAIEAYDAFLVGQADLKAHQVAGAPTFHDQLTDAQRRDDEAKASAAEAMRPGRDPATIHDPEVR
jgi:hypothetical protein